MAIDDAILSSVAARETPPTLRLYAWSRPCLSLGYGQQAHAADLVQLAAHNTLLVRRPTGGRAILHIDELTYSLALPITHPLAQGGVVESYRKISEALLLGLGALGASVAAERTSETAEMPSPVCFDTPSHYEIAVEGRKLVGSAQMRRRDGILQHGTLPLCGDITRICDVLAYPDEAAREVAKAEVRRRATTLEQALGRRIEWQMAAEAVATGCVEAFGIDFMPGELAETECETATRLARDLYGGDAWTFRR